MIEIKHSKEIEKTFNKIKMSILKTMKTSDIMTKYEGKELTKEDEKKIIEIYSVLGINTDSLKKDISSVTKNPYFTDVNLKNIKNDDIQVKSQVLKEKTLLPVNFPFYDEYLFELENLFLTN